MFGFSSFTFQCFVFQLRRHHSNKGPKKQNSTAVSHSVCQLKSPFGGISLVFDLFLLDFSLFLLIQPIFKIPLLNSPEKSNSPKSELTSSGIFLSLPVRSGWKLLYNSLLSSIHLFSLVLNKNCKPIQISLGIWGSKDVIKSVGQNSKRTYCSSDNSSKHLKNTLH